MVDCWSKPTWRDYWADFTGTQPSWLLESPLPPLGPEFPPLPVLLYIPLSAHSQHTLELPHQSCGRRKEIALDMVSLSLRPLTPLSVPWSSQHPPTHSVNAD